MHYSTFVTFLHFVWICLCGIWTDMWRMCKWAANHAGKQIPSTQKATKNKKWKSGSAEGAQWVTCKHQTCVYRDSNAGGCRWRWSEAVASGKGQRGAWVTQTPQRQPEGAREGQGHPGNLPDPPAVHEGTTHTKLALIPLIKRLQERESPDWTHSFMLVPVISEHEAKHMNKKKCTQAVMGHRISQ